MALGTALKTARYDSKKIHRELPFVLNERHGKIYGVIDLVFQDEAGRWHIVDYKTAAGDSEKAVHAAYDFQIAVYAAAFYEISGVIPASGAVYFLKNQGEHKMPMSLEILAQYAGRLRKTQEEILDFSTARKISGKMVSF